MFGSPFEGRLLASKVVLMQSSKGAVDSIFLVMLTRNFLCWKINRSSHMSSLACSQTRVRNAKSLVASGLVRFINSCCFPPL